MILIEEMEYFLLRSMNTFEHWLFSFDFFLLKNG